MLTTDVLSLVAVLRVNDGFKPVVKALAVVPIDAMEHAELPLHALEISKPCHGRLTLFFAI